MIGHPDRPEVRLTSMDWHEGAKPWTQGNIRSGRGVGSWAIEVNRPGRYRIEIRRYPREANQPAGAVKATVRIGRKEKDAMPVSGGAAAVVTMNLTAGKHDLAGLFRDAKGKEFGSFFAYVRRLE